MRAPSKNETSKYKYLSACVMLYALCLEHRKMRWWRWDKDNDKGLLVQRHKEENKRQETRGKRQAAKGKRGRKKILRKKGESEVKERMGEKTMQYYRFGEPVIIAGPRNAHRRPLILSPFYFPLLLIPFLLFVFVLGFFCFPSLNLSLSLSFSHIFPFLFYYKRWFETAVLPW